MILEEQIIGAMLIDEDAYDKVCDWLQSKHFSNQRTRLIYDSMRILKIRRWPINLFSVCEQLSQMGCLLMSEDQGTSQNYQVKLVLRKMLKSGQGV